jgi:hypothetical protein
MTSIANPSVIIQSSSRARACPPPWFGEVVLIAEHLRQQGVLTTICERVRFARRRMGVYEVIDFLVVQIALRQKFRTHPRSLLRGAPTLFAAFHGALRA